MRTPISPTPSYVLHSPALYMLLSKSTANTSKSNSTSRSSLVSVATRPVRLLLLRSATPGARLVDTLRSPRLRARERGRTISRRCLVRRCVTVLTSEFWFLLGFLRFCANGVGIAMIPRLERSCLIPWTLRTIVWSL